MTAIAPKDDILVMKVLIILLLVLCASCDFGPSGNMSTMYYDSHIATAFENKLIKNEIPFKRIEDQFFYSIKKQDEVKILKSEINDYYHGMNKQVFSDRVKVQAVIKNLEIKGIEHYLFETDDGQGIGWDKNRYDEGRSIVFDVMELPQELREELENPNSDTNIWARKEKGGVIIKRIDLNLIEMRLDELGIDYRVSDAENGVSVAWEVKNNEPAMKAVMSVVSKREKKDRNE